MLAIDAEESSCLTHLPDELLLDAHMAFEEREGARPDSRGARRLAGSPDPPETVRKGHDGETPVLVRKFVERTRRDVFQELRAQNASYR